MAAFSCGSVLAFPPLDSGMPRVFAFFLASSRGVFFDFFDFLDDFDFDFDFADFDFAGFDFADFPDFFADFFDFLGGMAATRPVAEQL